MPHQDIAKISELLIRDHVIILKDIESLKKIPKESADEFTRQINNLKFSIERHIYLEEKAVFLFCELEEFLGNDFMTRIFTDHDIILKKLELIQSGSDIQRQFYLKKFAPFLYDHVNFEEKTFYTKLDEMMSEKNKVLFRKNILQDRNLGYYPIRQMREYAKTHIASICKN